jgi:sarcosine oxidase subunit gamma
MASLDVLPAAERRTKLGGAASSSGGTLIDILPPASRLSLRAGADAVEPLSAALGLALPVRPATSATEGQRFALWLGPDEWLVVDGTNADLPALCSGVTALHSAVDVSHRNVALKVSGPGAEATLNAGCPRDLSLDRFPVGACSRTILGKAEVLVWRTGDDAFRVECWRSFADYVHGMLMDGAADASR